MANNTIQLLNNEKVNALSNIDFSKFSYFMYEFMDEEVGHDYTGGVTTVRDELQEVVKMAYRAYASEGVNYYKAYNAYRYAELTEEERLERTSKLYTQAGKKLLFLNACAKKLTGSGFVCRKVDKNDMAEMVSLVDAFSWCVRNYNVVIRNAK